MKKYIPCLYSSSGKTGSILPILIILIIPAFSAALFSGCTLLKAIPGITEKALNESGCSEEADRTMETGDIEKGIKLHREFLSNNPENAVAWYHLGYALGMQGLTENEISCYEKAEALGYRGNGDLYFNLGMACAEQQNYNEAEQAFLKSLEINPSRIQSRINLARIYMENLGQPLKARDQLVIVLKADPQNGEALELAHQLLGNYPP
jgi:tetratricopeptide (TPR) repeat protein